MKSQRKPIAYGRNSSVNTELTSVVLAENFIDGPLQNVHGLQCTMSASPFGPDETMVGRWYVVLLPASIANDTDLRQAWISRLDTLSSANDALSSSEFVWGAGSFICAEQAPFNLTFAPKTSRNVPFEARLMVLMVADAISGVVDNWDASASFSYFVST